MITGNLKTPQKDDPA